MQLEYNYQALYGVESCRVEFSKTCEGILRDFWEEFSRKKLPARPVDIQKFK